MPYPLNWQNDVNGQFTNISASPSTLWMASPVSGTLRRISLTLVNAITVANATITAKVDNVAVPGSLTIAFTGSAKGTVFTWNLNYPVKQGSLIEVISDGGSTTTCIAPVTVTVSA